ncbi:hypothetical protein ABZ942_42235 [Nocardia sp. NPDC046473]|uniref:hypothetical protein n=1 Tax=Nocardia sp. NPDC046473 TaxID=3155733 RepID=UPI0033E17A3E
MSQENRRPGLPDANELYRTLARTHSPEAAALVVHAVTGVWPTDQQQIEWIVTRSRTWDIAS